MEVTAIILLTFAVLSTLLAIWAVSAAYLWNNGDDGTTKVGPTGPVGPVGATGAAGKDGILEPFQIHEIAAANSSIIVTGMIVSVSTDKLMNVSGTLELDGTFLEPSGTGTTVATVLGLSGADVTNPDYSPEIPCFNSARKGVGILSLGVIGDAVDIFIQAITGDDDWQDGDIITFGGMFAMRQ